MPSRRSDAWNIPHEIHAERSKHGVDAAIALLADRQHAVVAHRQMKELGVGRGAIAHRVKRRRLHPQLPGTYSVGRTRLQREGRLTAAVLSAGPGAVISHRSAADLWGIRLTASAQIDVTVPRRTRPRPAVRVHVSRLPDDEMETVLGIPVTSPGRTLLDLAATLPPSGVERALERTEALKLNHIVPMSELLARHPRRPGAATLKNLAAKAEAIRNPARSPLEDAFMAFLERTGLPPPEVNVPVEIAGRLLIPDCLWRAERIMVELDGFETHGTPQAFVRDRRKDRLLAAAGLRVVRVTWSDLEVDRPALERDLRRLLERAAA